MTALHERPTAELVTTTDADARRSVQRALQRAGVSYDQLAEQASRDDFSSLDARIAWIAVRDLRDLA